jgi:hypothetical protein
MIAQLRLLCCFGLAVMLNDVRPMSAETSIPELSGTYRCMSDTRTCQSPTLSISQRGQKLEVSSEQGDTGIGEVTSNVSLTIGPPWNAMGTILPDRRTIEWATGTRWQRQ